MEKKELGQCQEIVGSPLAPGAVFMGNLGDPRREEWRRLDLNPIRGLIAILGIEDTSLSLTGKIRS